MLLVVGYTIKAATLTVSAANETALKNAIASANNGDVVDITTTGTITLTSTIYFDKAITIKCSNPAGIKISGDGSNRIFEISVPIGVTSLKNLHIFNGVSPLGGAGGIYFYTSELAGATLSIENCTISGCSTSGSQAFGGGIGGSADLNLLNCTFSGNSATDGGGALALYDNISIVNINHCTFTNNYSAAGTTGGLDLYENSHVTIKNSIIANNKVGTIIDNFEIANASLISGGYNLSDGVIPNSVVSDLSNKNLANEIKLSSLADNGGGVQTCAIALGSLAVNGALISSSLTDQCGNSRSGIADIGAYELLLPIVTTNDVSSLIAIAAQLNGQVVVNGSSISSNEFQYGNSSGNYTSTVTAVASGTTTLTTSYTLSGLIGGQTVYYRAKTTVGVSPAYTFYGAEKSFTTPKQSQTITFNALPTNKKYGDADFALGATAPGGTVTYSSSNSSIASIVGGNLHILKSGTVTITASQSGNSQYAAATPVDQSITIAKAPLTVTASSASRKYGEINPAFTVSYSGFVNSETATSLTTQPTAWSIAISNSTVGGYDVEASGGVSDKYEFSYTKGVLTVNKADLNIKANNKSKDYGTANPAFDFTYSGFIFGESVANLTTLPNAACSATATSGANSYAIVPSGAAATNYAIAYTNGSLTINKVQLLITADNKTKEVGQVNPTFTFSYSGFVAGDDETDLLTLPSALCAASELSPAGDYPIIPNGATSNNYNILIENGTLTILVATGVDKLGVSSVQISPNPSTGLFKVEGVNEGALLTVVVRDITGNVIMTTSEGVIDLTSKANGIYILSVNIDGVTKVFKVVKK